MIGGSGGPSYRPRGISGTFFTLKNSTMEKWMQVDVKNLDEKYAICNLYADGRCVQVIMRADDYELLKHEGFFIRSGKERDSAGVLNTSGTYALTK